MTISPARPETPPPTDGDEPGAGGSARRGVWSQLRPLVLRLHFYAGVFVAPFILVAAFTGLLYTMSPQIESTAYSAQLTVEPDGPTLPLSEQVAAARDAHPDGQLVEVRPPVAEDSSTRVVFTDASVPDGYAMTVFVDPHDARVLGEVRSYGQWLGIRAQLDDLHRNLLLGDVGRHYSELAASWLGVVVLGGLALWFTKRRRDRRLRRLLLPEPAGAGGRGQARRRTLSWHATLGVWVALGALMLSVSGLTWSRYAGENIGDLRTTMGWDTPAVSTSLDGSAPAHGGGHHHGPSGGADDAAITDGVGIDGVTATARASGLRAPLVVTPPAEEGTAWKVAENKRSWPTWADAVAVDPATGEVTDTLRFADMPFMAKMTRWVIDAHMGLLFGVANQLALAAVAIALMVGIVLGYRSWWQRRPTRGDARVGRPPARGAWRRTTWPVRIGVALVAVAAGWFVPLLGLSLAAFLLLDVALGWHRGRADRADPAASPEELVVG